jgi:hypothetical protein
MAIGPRLIILRVFDHRDRSEETGISEVCRRPLYIGLGCLRKKLDGRVTGSLSIGVGSTRFAISGPNKNHSHTPQGNGVVGDGIQHLLRRDA